MGLQFDLVATTYEAEFERLPKTLVPKHRFEVTLEPDSFTEEKFAVYKNYQINVHHDPPSKVTPSSFKRFLCSSPFGRTERAVDGCHQKLGGYHQLYRLDGRLIAMGVIDLLPHCVSGVYFLYHQDFEKWGLGKLSALREASLAIEGGYGYYYMGFYIHSCSKMTYKNEYKPQYFLDLETYGWNPLDGEARRLMDTHHYLSMSQVAREQESNGTSQNNELDTVEAASAEKNIKDGAVAAKQIEMAIRQGTSLFHLEFPGMLTMDELDQQIHLDKVKIRIPGGMIVPCDVRLCSSFRAHI
jgi:arginyl-tRNA---protein transferase